jgi:hypothetical protein
MKSKKQKVSGLDFCQTFELARMWKALCRKNFEKTGDIGTCVLGARLEQNGVKVIDASHVSPAQGSLVWETGLDKLLKAFNKKYGTNVRYYEGMMA